MNQRTRLRVAAAVVYPRLVLMSAIVEKLESGKSGLADVVDEQSAQLEAGKGGLVNEVPVKQEPIQDSSGGELVSFAEYRARKVMAKTVPQPQFQALKRAA